MTFDEWWNADNLTSDNPYEPDSAAYWAWEGYQVAKEQAAKLCEDGWKEGLGARFQGDVFAAAIRGMI